MSFESRPLLSTSQTRQNYYAFPDSSSKDSMYRQTIDSLSIRRCSSFTTSSIRELEDDGYLLSSGRCPTIDTTNEEKEDRDSPPHTTTTAHSNLLESIFDLFSCSLYLENNAAVARDHLGRYKTTFKKNDFFNLYLFHF